MTPSYLFRLLFSITLVFSNYHASSQCFNTTKWPVSDISAPMYGGQTVVVATDNFAGHYCVIKDLIPGKSYTFSASALDFISHRIVGGLVANTPIGFGNSPYTFTAMGHNGEFHINLLSPPCGTDMTNRTTSIVCNDCPTEPSKMGVNETSPSATLDVNGEIQLTDSGRPPQVGMVRWNSATIDFEGYDGAQWRSFTKAHAGWGTQPNNNGNEDKKLTASDGTATDYFGYSVSISGDYAIIGAYAEYIGTNGNQGSAYVFIRSGTSWIQQAKLIASDGAPIDRLGYSVSISGDYAIVGAYSDDIGSNTNQGSAYVFIRSGTSWTQQAKLTASDGATSDHFGYSVSISGDYAISGAYSDDIGSNTDQGSAYVFIRSGTNWTQQAKLTASDGAANDIFGVSVSINGDYAIVGADSDDIGANTDQGTAYVFIRSGTNWTQQIKLTASDGAANDQFGVCVSISGDYAIVGAYSDDIGSNVDQGSAYVFIRSGTSWTQQAKLTASDGAASDIFGISVSINGDYAIVSANFDDIGSNTNQGSAYVFIRSGTNWTQQIKFTASDGAANDQFGYSVSISGDYAIVGAYLDDIGTISDQGSAYIFIKK